MCGIAGIAAFRNARSPVREQIHAMCETIVHRGPNDEGILARRFGLGMHACPLSISSVPSTHL